MRVAVALITIALVACAPSAPEAPAPAVPAEIEAAVRTFEPDITITGGAQDGDEYEVSGVLPNGDEVEIDLVHFETNWRVDEIQRDIAWAAAPETVRAAAAAAPNAFEPVRVIESRQPVDGSIIYELFSPTDQPGAPSMEVRLLDGEAAVMPRPH